MANWWEMDDEERWAGKPRDAAGSMEVATGAAKPLGVDPVPEGENLDVANWQRRMEPHRTPLEPPRVAVPGTDLDQPGTPPVFEPKPGPLEGAQPPGMLKGQGTVGGSEEDKIRNQIRADMGLPPLPPGQARAHSLEPGAQSRLGLEDENQLTSQVAGPEGFAEANPQARFQQRPIVPMSQDPWRGLHQQLANLTVDQNIPPQEKLRRLQGLLQQRDMMSQQMGQQGQARQAQMKEFQEIQQAQQAFAPRPLSPQEMIHFQQTAQQQIPMPGRPKQWTKQSAGQYNMAVRQWQQRVQAQVQQWANMEMQTRKLASQQQFGAWQKERAEDRRDDRQAQREEGKENRQADRQERAAIEAEKRAAQREKEKDRANEIKLAQEAERAQEKDFEKAQKEQRERSQQQRIASYNRHLRVLEKEQVDKAKLKGEGWSEVPHATLVQEAHRRVLEEERLFGRGAQVGSEEWQNDQDGEARKKIRGGFIPGVDDRPGEPGDDFGGGEAPVAPRISPEDQAKAFGEMIRKAILGR